MTKLLNKLNLSLTICVADNVQALFQIQYWLQTDLTGTNDVIVISLCDFENKLQLQVPRYCAQQIWTEVSDAHKTNLIDYDTTNIRLNDLRLLDKHCRSHHPKIM